MGADEVRRDGPAIGVYPNLVSFNTPGSPVNLRQMTLHIWNDGTGSLNWQIATPTGCDWLSINPPAGESTDQTNEVTLAVNTTGLTYGYHSCQLKISDPNAQPDFKTVEVSLILYPPVIGLGATDFEFYTWLGDPSPPAQVLSLQNLGGCVLDWQVSMPDNCGWLSAYPLKGRAYTDTNDVTLTVDTTALGFGFHGCQLTITDPNAVNSPQIVSVALYLRTQDDRLYVPNEYPTIQSAIDWALPGDVVVVAPGTYTGPGNRDIDFLGKPITVRSTDPTDPNIVAATMIDCNNSSMSFHFHNGEDANSVLDGLTIIGGKIQCSPLWRPYPHEDKPSSPLIRNCIMTSSLGECINLRHSSPMIIDCLFTNNASEGYLATILCNGGSPTIVDCVFTNNISQVIECWGGAPTIIGCVFAKNGHDRSFGVIESSSCANLTLIDCAFTDNLSLTGGGLYLRECNSTISDCTFRNNTATSTGGAIRIRWDSTVTIAHCNFQSNTALTAGGAIAMGRDSNLTITNSRFVGNFASGKKLHNRTDSWGGALYMGCGGDNTVSVVNCLLVGNSALWGGALCGESKEIFVANCTFANNRAAEGNTLYCSPYYCPEYLFSTVHVRDSIVWDDQDSMINPDGEIFIASSDILGGWPGEGNIDIDPCFVDPGYWDPNGTPEDPNDDFWVDGDYHLKSQAGRWDTNEGRWTK
jgi:predicted outer membrane repeat protein